MPVSETKLESLQKSVTEIEKRLSLLEQAAKPGDHSLRNGLIFAVLAAMLSVVGGFGRWAYGVTKDLTAMKQQLVDGGNKQIVTELKAPKSAQQLQANLSTVIAQVETARSEGKTPNPAKLSSLSTAVAYVIHRDPDLPEAWQAAVEVVNYKF